MINVFFGHINILPASFIKSAKRNVNGTHLDELVTSSQSEVGLQ